MDQPDDPPITNQLLAVIPPAQTELAIAMPDMTMVPALIADAGEQASQRSAAPNFHTGNRTI